MNRDSKTSGRMFVLLVIGFSIMGFMAASGQTVEADSLAYAVTPGETIQFGNQEFGPMLLKTFLSLAIIVGLVWAAAWVMKRMFSIRKGREAVPVHVVSSTPLGPKKNLSIIQVQGQRFLLGVTDASISMLTELDFDPESDAKISDSREEGMTANKFKQVLDAFTGKQTKHE